MAKNFLKTIACTKRFRDKIYLNINYWSVHALPVQMSSNNFLIKALATFFWPVLITVFSCELFLSISTGRNNGFE